jgi:hypothetical protein
MSSLIDADEISHETDIVWLEDIDELDYVRQSIDRLPTRKGRPPYRRPGRMVGYAILGPDAKASRASGTFRRRVLLAPAPRPRQRTRRPVRQERPRRSRRPTHPRTPRQGLQDRTLRRRTALRRHAGTRHRAPAVAATPGPAEHR